MTDRSKQPEALNPINLVGKGIDFHYVQKTAEPRDERASRLKRAEAEDAHGHRIDLILHLFAMGVWTAVLLGCVRVLFFIDSKSDKAWGVITVIISATAGYLTGKGSKEPSTSRFMGSAPTRFDEYIARVGLKAEGSAPDN